MVSESNWIAGAIKHPGGLHRALDVPEGKKIPASKIRKAEHSKNGHLRHMAQLADTLKGFHHEGLELTEYVIEGNAIAFGDCIKEALKVKLQVALEQRRREIAEQMLGPDTINELSAATLGSYVKKSKKKEEFLRKDADYKWELGANHAKAANDTKDDYVKDNIWGYSKAYTKLGNKANHQANNRARGQNRAINRLVNKADGK